jgi:hypothetical protein
MSTRARLHADQTARLALRKRKMAAAQLSVYLRLAVVVDAMGSFRSGK